ncbi:MAG: relaxase/mobilization nuclease domain-containing protein [Lachnospiraceae bacterium]
MAITKIHAIKATVNKAIEYICNPDKTDESIYISAFACAAETASYDFKYALDHANDFNSIEKAQKENQAFHLIQAFEPGEVSFEEAHTIGKKLADKLLEGKYSYVLTTHIDKGHVHNHIVFCAVDNIEHNHYHDCKQTYWNIRNLSDKLCRKHNLSVIENSNKRGIKYKEWYENKNQNSWKVKLKKDINQSIKGSSCYDDFLALMKAKGYEIKNDSFEEGSGKYIAFRPLGEKNFIRGRANSLGANFTKERIKERIDNKRVRSTSFLKKDKRVRNLINMVNAPTFTENIGLQKWATKENLKIAAKTYLLMTEKNIHSLTELDTKVALLQEQAKSANNSIVSLEYQILEMAETIKYAEQYRENKPFNDRYENAKDQDKFLRKYESKIILYGGAERMLQRKGFTPTTSNISTLKSAYQNLLAQKRSLSSMQKSSQNEIKELEQIKKNMEQYLRIMPTDSLPTLEPDRPHER